jgi:hypothetical protein
MPTNYLESGGIMANLKFADVVILAGRDLDDKQRTRDGLSKELTW